MHTILIFKNTDIRKESERPWRNPFRLVRPGRFRCSSGNKGVRRHAAGHVKQFPLQSPHPRILKEDKNNSRRSGYIQMRRSREKLTNFYCNNYPFIKIILIQFSNHPKKFRRFPPIIRC
jgi:hypothetical protein